MRRLLTAGLLVSAISCSSRPTESGLEVVINLDETHPTNSTCLRVTIRAAAAELSTEPIVMNGRSAFRVAVARGAFPEEVTVSARGYADAACTTEPSPRESAEDTVRFKANQIVRLSLTLRRAVTGDEAGLCDNGVDDDQDGHADCLDDDCAGYACDSGSRCVTGGRCSDHACQDGEPVECTTPPPCFIGVGPNSCSPNLGCTYAPDLGRPCDDRNPCTSGDACGFDGGCAGAPVTCAAAASSCLGAGTCAVMGDAGVCSYTAKTHDACDDGALCTQGDRCQADGGCAGLALSCEALPCTVLEAGCAADGGCLRSNAAAGEACAGGVCNASGGCVPDFGYSPSNFLVGDLQTPAPEVTLDCPEASIDTGSGSTPPSFDLCGQPSPPWRRIAQPSGPAALILSFSSVTLEGDAVLRLVGADPVIIAALGDITIAGQLIVEAGAQSCGATAQGGGGDGTPDSASGGGGGGALGTRGGDGAPGGLAGGTSGSGGAPGEAVSGADALVPLRGGCHGGRGGRSDTGGGSGGGGVQLSARGTLLITGLISAPGRGGPGGPTSAAGNAGASGGGSGGAMLLEARVLVVDGGVLAANGGAGGEGAEGSTAPGLSGADGALASTSPAAGGTHAGGGSHKGGPGGAGAARGAAAQNGNPGQPPGGGGGGGGGGLGRVRLNPRESCAVSATISAAVTSSQPPDSGCP